MYKIAAFITFEKIFEKKILSHKSIVKKKFGNQIYLNHPVHLTLFTIYIKTITQLKKIYLYNDAKKAVHNADVIFSDKVISLNDKVNVKRKLKEFKNFKIDRKLFSYAKKDCIFLHCLPRGNEVTDEIFLGKKSHVWQQALNRVHVQKSILLYCFGKLR